MLAGTLLVLVLPFLGPVFRDNDQAALIGGSWQLAHGDASFFDASFYNFDKQWGVFLALDGLYRLLPHADPVWAANVLQALLVAACWPLLAWRMGRSRRVPIPLVLPVLAAPVLVLYMPFLGTAWFSLAFLLAAFFFLGSRQRAVGVLLVAVAAACRADIILAIPALSLSLTARRSLRNLLRQKLAWALSAAALLPPLFGKLIVPLAMSDSNPFSVDLRAYAGFLFFGLSPALLFILAGTVWTWWRVAVQRPRYQFFYALFACSPLLSLAFYSPQLYTLRYLFLTAASVLFVASSPRSVILYRSLVARLTLLPAILVTLTLVPWIVGLRLPDLHHPSLTVTNPTRFPSGDGLFPMAGYLGFAGQVFSRDHLSIDHNQKVWQAAASVDYQACQDGAVPFLYTPMSNFVELAIRLQGKKPLGIDHLDQSACGVAYVDARSVVRGYRPVPRDGPIFDHGIRSVSQTNNGQLVVRLDSKGGATLAGRTLQQLREVLGRYETDIFLKPPLKMRVDFGTPAVVFSAEPCQLSFRSEPLPRELGLIRGKWQGQNKTSEANCPNPFSGWARRSLPTYLGL